MLWEICARLEMTAERAATLMESQGVEATEAEAEFQMRLARERNTLRLVTDRDSYQSSNWVPLTRSR